MKEIKQDHICKTLKIDSLLENYFRCHILGLKILRKRSLRFYLIPYIKFPKRPNYSTCNIILTQDIHLNDLWDCVSTAKAKKYLTTHVNVFFIIYTLILNSPISKYSWQITYVYKTSSWGLCFHRSPITCEHTCILSRYHGVCIFKSHQTLSLVSTSLPRCSCNRYTSLSICPFWIVTWST